MKHWITAAAAATLAACSQAPDADEETGFVPRPGLYGVGDGTTIYSRTQINADGTYVDLNDEGPVGGGRWAWDGSVMCFDPEGDGENQQERCWTNGPVAADGSFMTTRVDTGQSYRVTPLDED